MGIFGGAGKQSNTGNDADKERLATERRRRANEIQIEESNIKTLETECAQLHTLKTKLELDHKKALREFTDDTLLIKKMQGDLHIIMLRAEKLKKETERIEAEMRQNEKKLTEQSRELLRQQVELKQEKKRFQDLSH